MILLLLHRVFELLLLQFFAAEKQLKPVGLQVFVNVRAHKAGFVLFEFRGISMLLIPVQNDLRNRQHEHPVQGPEVFFENSDMPAEAINVKSTAMDEAWAVYERAIADAEAVFNQAKAEASEQVEAWDVWRKAWDDAYAVRYTAKNEAWCVFKMAEAEAMAVYDKAMAGPQAVRNKAEAVFDHVTKVYEKAEIAFQRKAMAVFRNAKDDKGKPLKEAEAWAVYKKAKA